MPATKRKATAVKQSFAFVVLFHEHTDDYKRADSDSGIVGVYDNEADAVKKCIVKNVANSKYYDTVTSDVLNKVLNTTSPVEEGYGPLSNYSRQEIKDAISSLTLKKLKTIDTELINSMNEIEAEYTMRPSMTTCSVHKKKILSAGDVSDDEED